MVINNLLVSKSNRQNDIPTHILKLCKNSLSPFLVQIFNLCIREGTYPQSLKCAQGCPFIKGVQRIYAPITDPSHSSHQSIKFLKNLSAAACTPILSRILCYLAINMVFKWVYLQHWQYMICKRISWRIQKRISLLVLSFVTCLKHVTLQIMMCYCGN